MVESHLETLFPNLAQSGYRETSPDSRRYNCIAWAAGEMNEWWWPDPNTYWPSVALCEESVEAFIQAYQSIGYESCDSGDTEPNFEKVAIYSDANGKPTHASRQLHDGKWTSKLGRGVDIEHDSLEGLSGSLYGSVTQIMKRPVREQKASPSEHGDQ